MTLHPQAQDFLNKVALSGRPGWEEMTPKQAREIFETFTDYVGESPEIKHVAEIVLAGMRCRLYSDASKPSPLMMYFHGGGWVLGSLQTHDVLCRSLAKESGCVVISVDYGRSPENAFPGPLDDCYNATVAAIEQANELKITPNRVVLAGDSAGGHLATMVAMRSRDRSGPMIALQVLLYPVVEPNFETGSYRQFASGFGLTRATMKWFWQHFLGNHSPSSDSVPTLAGSLARLPPTVLISAEYDVLHDEGLAFATKLSDAGVEVSIKRYPGMLHGFMHFAGLFDDGRKAVRDVGKMIRQKLT
ncbi:Carboxylesterase NlhH [Rubripirellula amarantea]|uniref:Carboxylesterase NlhH n=1 Tax=Rubripirellula amarantea TaxID=2527999 RepID=A0A5C5WU73_9BACT|nr:alpha/beta hydrolase [Rubripirellula amarantea]TWT53412.1 Carboxylesterase NlhH [Rubripirellula amarantea]